jgi:hypothetical protein
VNLGKSNWQITGYPASLRKIDAEALNCNLHPKKVAIEQILKLEYDWILQLLHGGRQQIIISGKAASTGLNNVSPPAPIASDSLL